jgi:MFS family permease
MIWHISFFSAMPADDAYIHMRIARNLVTHGVPYFNVDQAVAGSSSVLWLLLVSGTFFVAGADPQYIMILSMVLTVALFAACTALFATRYSRVSAVCLAFVLLACTALGPAAALMETPTALLFWTMSLVFAHRRAWVWVGVCAGLAVATRYEFALWATLVLCIPDTMKNRGRVLAGLAPVGMALTAFNMYFFGALIPHTVKAKAIVYSDNVYDSFYRSGLPTNLWLFISMVIVFGVLIWLCMKQRVPRSMYIGGIFGMLILLLYLAQDVFIFPWYMPIYMYPILGAALYAYSTRHAVVGALATTVLVFFGSAAVILATENAHALHTHDLRAMPGFTVGMRVQQYLAIGDDLAREFPSATVMAPEIGGLAWTFPGHITDAVGLVSPECLVYHPLAVPQDRPNSIIGAIPPGAVRDLQPDIIVSMEIFSEAVRRDMANGTITGYRLYDQYPLVPPSVSEEPSSFWDSTWIQVFARMPAKAAQ